MSKFRIYNIQLLPTGDEAEVGVAGYRRLFSELREANKRAHREGTQNAFHYGLTGDTYIGPRDFKFPAGYVAGNFTRYTKADQLTDLRTRERVFKAKKGRTAVVSDHEIPFVFNTAHHLLAIDEADLPKNFIEVLTHLLGDLALKVFPNHELTINLVSQPGELEKIFETAVAYQLIELKLAFPNGHETEELLRQLKESKTQLKISASAGDRGKMRSVPAFLKEVLRASVAYGWAKITYFVPARAGTTETRRVIYDSQENPLTFVARHSAQDNENEFFDRVNGKLLQLDVSEEGEG